jgi:hypothetical protein
MKTLSKYTRTKLIWHNGKKQRAHRVIMELHLGRPLFQTEEVHHINKNPLDNRIENLIVMDRGEHIALHAEERQRYSRLKECIECGERFIPKPKKAGRQKCCNNTCAQKIRVRSMMKARGY